jgi:hypothetical protein
MGPCEMVVAIILIVTVGKIIQTKQRPSMALSRTRILWVQKPTSC